MRAHLFRFSFASLVAASALAASVQACSKDDPSTGTDDQAVSNAQLGDIKHWVILYLENHSFDNLYGEFEGAENLKSLAPNAPNMVQVDENGAPYGALPMALKSDGGLADPRLPSGLPNGPFAIEEYIPSELTTSDLHHNFITEQRQINGGKMNQFVLWSDARGLSMGHYKTANLQLAKYAKDYVLCDHFFHAAFGGSFLNHQWLIAARTPEYGTTAPTTGIVDPNTLKYGETEGPAYFDSQDNKWYAVNTSYSVSPPHPANVGTNPLVPLQTYDNIGDRLTAANVDWAWYSGGWNVAVAWKPGSNLPAPTESRFQYHHQPFVYFARYAEGTPGRTHLKDEDDFFAAAAAGKLPAVSFVKPAGIDNEHPGYAPVARGELHAAKVVDAVMHSPTWNDTAIIVAYDEHGGFWDHVSPPKGDKWGPGSRVPAMIISPFVKKGTVDHTVYDTTSILATLEKRFNLPPLTSRDAHAKDMTAAFNFMH